MNSAGDFCYFCGEVTFSSQKFVRAMDRTGPAFGYLTEKFPTISAAVNQGRCSHQSTDLPAVHR